MIFSVPSKNSIDAIGAGLADCDKIFRNFDSQIPENKRRNLFARYENTIPQNDSP
jgi:hypothetical protein